MKEILFSLLLLISLLTGCAVRSPKESAQREAPASEAASPALSDQAATGEAAKQDELYLLTAQQGIVMTVGGETQDGCYSLDPYPDGTADLIYYDYQTQQCVQLSSDANLKHDPASSAYFPSFKGGARCLVSGKNLYILKSGQPYIDASVAGNDPVARLYCMTLNGADRTVTEYGSNVVFQWDACVAGDAEGMLYTVLTVVDPETAQISYVLAKLGKGMPTCETIAAWDARATVALAGVCKDGFLISKKYATPTKAETQLQIYRKDGAPGQTILEWEANSVTGFTLFDNVLYYTQRDDPLLYAKPVQAPSDIFTIDPSGFTDFKPEAVYLRDEVRDRHLMFQVIGENDQQAYAAVDLASKTIFPLQLYAGKGEDRTFVGIFAEGQEDFLVRVGKFTRNRTDYGPDGTPYTYEQGFEDYVLISKEDYWNSKPHYRRFDFYE